MLCWYYSNNFTIRELQIQIKSFNQGLLNENMKLHQIVRKLNKRLDVTPKTTINYNLFHTICYIAEALDARSFCSVWLVLECVSLNHVKMYVKRQLDVWFVSYLINCFLLYLHTLHNSLFYPFHIMFPGTVRWCFHIWLHDKKENCPLFSLCPAYHLQ